MTSVKVSTWVRHIFWCFLQTLDRSQSANSSVTFSKSVQRGYTCLFSLEGDLSSFLCLSGSPWHSSSFGFVWLVGCLGFVSLPSLSPPPILKKKKKKKMNIQSWRLEDFIFHEVNESWDNSYIEGVRGLQILTFHLKIRLKECNSVYNIFTQYPSACSISLKSFEISSWHLSSSFT